MGLDDFKTDDSSSSDSSSEDNRKSFSERTHPAWNRLSKDEKVAYIRENSIKDYNPAHQIGDEWAWDDAVVIECSCGAILFTTDKVVCKDCKTEYEYADRTVRNVTEEKKILE